MIFLKLEKQQALFLSLYVGMSIDSLNNKSGLKSVDTENFNRYQPIVNICNDSKQHMPHDINPHFFASSGEIRNHVHDELNIDHDVDSFELSSIYKRDWHTAMKTQKNFYTFYELDKNSPVDALLIPLFIFHSLPSQYVEDILDKRFSEWRELLPSNRESIQRFRRDFNYHNFKETTWDDLDDLHAQKQFAITNNQPFSEEITDLQTKLKEPLSLLNSIVKIYSMFLLALPLDVCFSREDADNELHLSQISVTQSNQFFITKALLAFLDLYHLDVTDLQELASFSNDKPNINSISKFKFAAATMYLNHQIKAASIRDIEQFSAILDQLNDFIPGDLSALLDPYNFTDNHIIQDFNTKMQNIRLGIRKFNYTFDLLRNQPVLLNLANADRSITRAPIDTWLLYATTKEWSSKLFMFLHEYKNVNFGMLANSRDPLLTDQDGIFLERMMNSLLNTDVVITAQDILDLIAQKKESNMLSTTISSTEGNPKKLSVKKIYTKGDMHDN